MDKIICLGKNYLDHAKELGDAVPERPVLFLKPPSALLDLTKGSNALKLPQNRGSIHHECEVVFRIEQVGDKLSVGSFGLGLDLTLRDLQSELKKKGHPWEVSKAFKHSAVIGSLLGRSHLESVSQSDFQFFVNDDLKQTGNTRQMRMGIDEALVYIQEYFPLCDGDLIFTGTPAGVGPLKSGDRLKMQWGTGYRHEMVCI